MLDYVHLHGMSVQNDPQPKPQKEEKTNILQGSNNSEGFKEKVVEKNSTV